MRIDIFSIFPDHIDQMSDLSILGRARRSGLVDLRSQDLRMSTTDKHRTVDDSPFGGGPGMVLKPEPVFAAVKEVCGQAHMKVILETGELDTLDNVRKSSEIAMHAGADFIKTSTGKISPAATMPATYVMLLAIKDYYKKNGIKIGMKPAGGISTSKQSLQYLVMLNETLGDDWMNKDLFRFGASRLANDILMQLQKKKSGFYQSLDYFSKD